MYASFLCPSGVIKKAFLAGTVTWAMIIFLDVVKSRIQADNPLDPKYYNIYKV